MSSDRLGSFMPENWQGLFETLIGQDVTIYLSGMFDSRITVSAKVVRAAQDFVEVLSTWTDRGRTMGQTSFVSYNNIARVFLPHVKVSY